MNTVSSEGPWPDPTPHPGTSPSLPDAPGLTPADALPPAALAHLRRDIDEQVDLRVQQHLAATPPPPRGLTAAEVPLVLGSLGIGIPLSAIAGGIAGGIAGLPGLIVAWVGLVLVNLAWMHRR